MSIIGIAAEYNPFHLGHEYHISQTRSRFGEESTVIACMSGDFVQRGDRACFSKYARARAACLGGADIVVELPVAWSLSSAEGFARGCVGILAAMGAGVLSFGSECGDVERLRRAAEAAASEELNVRVRALLKAEPNMNYPAARQRVAEAMIGEDAALLSSPNDLLGIEYIKALHTLQCSAEPYAVKRVGAGHDRRGEGFASASYLRELTASGQDIASLVPKAAGEIFAKELAEGRYASDSAFELALLSRLRSLKRDDFAALPDGGDGIGERLFRAVRSETSLENIISSAMTKRYTASRVRRMLMCAALSLRSGDSSGIPPYIRILAANERGCEYLGKMRGQFARPVITKPAGVSVLSTNAQRHFALGADAHDLFSLCFATNSRESCGTDMKTGPYIVNSQQNRFKSKA